MNEQAFAEQRNSDWKRLQMLTDQADGRGIRKLSDREFRELLRLYKRASADLAMVRAKSRNVALVDFLNDLVARAYALLYRVPRKPFGDSIIESVASAAQTVRRRKAFVLLASAIFFGSWIFTFLLISSNADAREIFVQGPMAQQFEEWKKGEFKERPISEAFMMNAVYASHNPQVSIVSGAIGAGTFGVGSLYMLFTNGAIIGALSYDMDSVGKLPFLLASIFPHGVTELSGMILSCAAGMLFGWGLISPGQKKRGDSLREVGKDGLVLLVTSVVLMFIAAPIEAYFSFNPNVPIEAKVGLAIFSFVAWMSFWFFYARTPEELTGAAEPSV